MDQKIYKYLTRWKWSLLSQTGPASVCISIRGYVFEFLHDPMTGEILIWNQKKLIAFETFVMCIHHLCQQQEEGDAVVSVSVTPLT